MKTTLTLFLSLFFIATFAQIPNNGFENWTNQGTYSTPDKWGTMNPITALLGIVTCEKGTPAPVGSYYMKLTAKNVLGMGVVQGLAFTGAIDTAFNQQFGFPYSSRPASLTGKWQYMAYGSDQGMILAALTKWNVGTQTSDTIAMITYPLPGMVMAWANFSLPFTYLSGATPDTAIVMFSTSGATPVAESYVWVDNINFSGTAGIWDIVNTDKFAMSPNPASDKLTITYHATETARVTISIFDLNGKLVKEYNPGYSTHSENHEMISINGISAGTYLLQLTIGDKITTDKLIIK